MKDPTPQPQKPNTLAVLRGARALLKERGWKPESAGDDPPFGPGIGPLTLVQALWTAGCYEGLVDVCVHVPPVGRAADQLCEALTLDKSLAFSELGRWCREPGRTAAEVDALFVRAFRLIDQRILDVLQAGDEWDA